MFSTWSLPFPRVCLKSSAYFMLVFLRFPIYFLFLNFNLINVPCHHILSVIINQKCSSFSTAAACAPKDYFLLRVFFCFFIADEGKSQYFFICFNKCFFTKEFFFVFTKINKVWPVLFSPFDSSEEARSFQLHNVCTIV